MALFGRLLSALNFIASLLIVGIMLLITTDVALRASLNMPLHGVPEITKFSIVCMVWLQMAYTLRSRHHLRSNLILRAMPVLGRQAILFLNGVLGAVVMGLIAYYSYPELIRAWTMGAFEGEHPVRIPTWPIWGIVTVGSALTAVEYVVQSVQALLGRDDGLDQITPASSASH